MRRRLAKGRRVKAFEGKPELFKDSALVWKAFEELHRGRRVDYAKEKRNVIYKTVAPLFVSDVIAWFSMHGIEGDERIEMFELVFILDKIWLDRTLRNANTISGN